MSYSKIMDKLDYYDFFAVFIPGGVLAMVFAFIQNDGSKNFLAVPLNISLGSSILILISIYVLGEAIQAIGKIIESIFWFFFRGKPTQWISDEPLKWVRYVKWPLYFIRTFSYKLKQDIVTAQEGKLICNWVKKLSSNGSSDAKSIAECFSRIQQIAFQSGENKKWLNIMLAKANMFRGFIVVSVVLLLVICFKSKTENDLVFLWCDIAFLVLSCIRYRSFSKNYAKKLYAIFLKSFNEQKCNPTTPRVATGVFNH